MMRTISLRPAALTVALASGLGAVFPGVAAVGSTATKAERVAETQAVLERQLTSRQSELARLTSDVANSKTLTAAHGAVLEQRLATETANIAALAAKVPGDTTLAELASDRHAMLKDNRVYAVEGPQVFATISADAISAQVATMEANAPMLASSVAALVGQPGYKNALAHDRSYVAALARVSTNIAHLVGVVIAQTPQDWPRDAHVFVAANRHLLAANIALAHASYDASIIGLATGGYTGS